MLLLQMFMNTVAKCESKRGTFWVLKVFGNTKMLDCPRLFDI